MGSLLEVRAQRSMDSIYKMMLQHGHKSGDWQVPHFTKNSSLSKNRLYMFVHSAITFLSHFTFFPFFQRVKNSPNCAISLINIYKIIPFDIQLTANVCKPKTNMQRRVNLQIWAFQLKGLIISVLSNQFFQTGNKRLILDTMAHLAL